MPAYKAVIFDMDGTLIEPIYDIIAANAAGAVSVPMATSARWREFRKASDFVIHRLSELEHIAGNGVS